ncbi:hypothetical protein A3F06_03675 [candidate division TM6 bacterium RIFCSPHIGHO2_12_FULL_36_22]|nr:MAG: hypothetical protein A3F06_03675 [candidate division TM6 bacterium RIFCSPHIGHO2_12_FULL_36_22]
MRVIKNIILAIFLGMSAITILPKSNSQLEELRSCLKLEQGSQVTPNNTVFLVDFHNVFAFTDWSNVWNTFWYHPDKFKRIFRTASYYIQKPFHTKPVQEFNLLQYLNSGSNNRSYQAANLLLVNSFKMDPPAIQLLKKIKDNGYKLILFSNTPETSIEWQAKAHPELFALFDAQWYRRIANRNLTKKHAESFDQVKELATTTLGHQPEHYIFIDDTHGNIKRAANVGICGILFKSINQTNDILSNLGILQ